MTIEIRKFPDPILQQVAVEATPGPDMDKLFENMLLAMEAEGGIGLAAPQVGVSVRAIVVRGENDTYKLLNPRVTKRSAIKIPTDERCLSVPGLTRRMSRSYSVQVKGTDAQGNPVTVDAKGMLSACFQHEIEHLDGKLIIK